MTGLAIGAPVDLPLDRILSINAAAKIPVERYQEDGCADRYAYLRDLAENHCLTIEQVLFASDCCGGPEEDFDALVTMLEDHADMLGGC